MSKRKMINKIAKDIVGYRTPAFDPFTNRQDGTLVKRAIRGMKRAGNVTNSDQRYFADRVCHSNVFKGKHKKGFYEPGKN
jgi:hypothetical protein